MDPPDALRQHLDALTDYLDIPGADLQAMLDVLIDDIIDAVPGFLGLRMTITAGGVSTTINTLNPHLAPTTQASLQLPLHLITAAAPADTIILYAAQPGAFTVLAAETRQAFHLDGQVVLDHHIPNSQLPNKSDPVIPHGVSSTDDAALINIAIGVLIDQGHPPEQAHDELARGAAQNDNNLSTAAEQILNSL